MIKGNMTKFETRPCGDHETQIDIYANKILAANYTLIHHLPVCL